MGLDAGCDIHSLCFKRMPIVSAAAMVIAANTMIIIRKAFVFISSLKSLFKIMIILFNLKTPNLRALSFLF
jgi:hypothetical protein